ncbi:hypothetical protein J5U18_13505 [Sphingobacteriaceae bacterium WQ 2009]|uniref:Uncharacterized protein n=1 Tax=Rhinopithecimicrobium faecis TaxID=2820698 RepID=A0A8T4HBR4_9SPHI|nr:hypothetical protein [Sphingobacteriaceae bacterium WQ 2009]
MNNFYFCFIVLFLFSCKKEIIPVESVDNPIATHHDLGKKLENPYAIRNIKKALNVLMSTRKQVIQNQDLERSHLYIRFLPKTYEDMLILESDSSLVYESVPFGYENSADLDFYQDPAIPKDQYTWQ